MLAYDAVCHSAVHLYLREIGMNGSKGFLIVSLFALCACQNGHGTDSTSTDGDSSPLQVITVSPASGSANIDVTSVITATFSKALDAASVIATTLTVTAGGAAVPGALSCNGTAATFTPSMRLPYNATVAVTISKSISDTTGRTLSADYSWNFTTVSFSGKFVLVTEAASSTLAKIDDSTDQIVSRISIGNMPQFIVSDQTHRLAYVSVFNDNAIVAVRPDTLETAKLNIQGLGQQPIGLTLTADGSMLLVANSGSDGAFSNDDRLDIVSLDPSVWPPTASLVTSVLTGNHPVTSIIDHDGKYAVITVRDEPAILIMDMSTYQIVAQVPGLPPNAEPEGCEAHPTENIVYVTLHGVNTLEVIDLDLLQDIKHVQITTATGVPAQPSTLHFTPDGSRAYVSAQTSNQVLLFDTADPRNPIQDTSVELSVGAQPHFIVWLPGDRAYVANTNNTQPFGNLSIIDNYSGTPTVSGPILTDLKEPLSFTYFNAQ